ncbi:hypothetical protein GQ43DRAFT_378137 [Delitschia confertaspora ATCC 74209]|uniref:protein-tyrosine-phosphatase n=1 Tax=Delitschia confertaspora ATCC 74209 TaxID=1513339 RepID=A0A9P4JI15_9PLEO|nr:hypothetical protein GQ43DRAFT_378137 [Delitschia confertaspora ATCC 74209]
MDSSSVTDPSPGPSPESPVAKLTPSSFVPDFRSRRSESTDNSPNTFFELQRPTTPAKKPRNLKNLGINTATSLTNLRGTNPSSSLPLLAKKEKNTSAPTSPSFIKPPTPPKRRPSNLSLTIQTPGSDPKPMRLIIPSTPAALNRPTLRHFQSSPSLPLRSPSVAPSGGMQLPPLRPLKTNPHGFAEIPIEVEEEDQEPNFDIPQSREEKQEAYPNGPICIYESGVYLYYEPRVDVAAEYDVIMNVASEVKNPFTTTTTVSQEELDARRKDGPPPENVDFAAIPKYTKTASLGAPNSPTTPRATPIFEGPQESGLQDDGSSIKMPEYIHVPWEHNTDIVPDLFKLVKIIEDRVQQGKRVLIHCQCGVSRSASLIVAYGLYKNPGITVQEAYDAVKKRSKWIGPNMNLIMQLQEFRNSLLNSNGDRAFQSQGFSLGPPRKSAGLSTGKSCANSRHSPFEMNNSSGPRTPRTAPLPEESDVTMQRASTGNMIALSPGPLSAPSGVFFSPGFRRSWASSQTHFDLSPKSSPVSTPYVDPQGHIIPVLSITHSDKSSGVVPPPLAEAPQLPDRTQLKSLPIPNFSRHVKKLSEVDELQTAAKDPASTRPDSSETLKAPTSDFSGVSADSQDEYPDNSEIMSPIRTEFPANPFGDLSSSRRSKKPQNIALPHLPKEEPQVASPRSREFHMIGFAQDGFDESHGVLSPRAATFDLGTSEMVQQQTITFEQSAPDSLEIRSPVATSFPKDMFPTNDDSLSLDIASPRAAEFHMAPLRPRVQVEDEDPFGIASPTRFEFPKDLFGNSQFAPSRDPGPETQAPSLQAILPPSHLDQTHTFHGFSSLNDTTQPPPVLSAPPRTVLPIPSPRIDSLSTSVKNDSDPAEQKIPNILTKSESPRLTLPGRQPSIRTRFSSPNMREQRQLHKLQTEMEALLPPKPPQFPYAMDDLEALKSPRAEEFTKNPFHFDLSSPVDEPSPASSNETIKEGQGHREWPDRQEWMPPAPIAEDPRSPVQIGGSPIIRNIWDVL